MKFNSDIDIDFGDREKVLSLIDCVPASMRNVNPIRRHATGVHVTEIPYDPVNNIAAIDYSEAESRGYIKLDLLNVHVYNQVRDERHLIDLMREPNWDRLHSANFVSKLIHLGNQFSNMNKMPEPINSIPRLSMFLAVIRPGKKHLIGEPWNIVSKTVWDKGEDGYQFKRSHAVAYAHLVCVHMNLLEENEFETSQRN